MKAPRTSPWKSVLSISVVIGTILLGAISFFYLRDEPRAPTPSWAVPIVRDPDAVSALKELFELESPLAELEETELDRIASGCTICGPSHNLGNISGR